jgi:arabinogalactan endo-1,4-beta-galactosidase
LLGITALVALLPAGVAGARSETTPPAPPKLLVGGDISGLARIEGFGGVFRLDGRPADAVEIMAGFGCNCFRLRLFVDPPHKNLVVNDLAYTLALAKRIKRAGAALLLDFHYSDTWADPGHQTKPAAWTRLDFDGLVGRVQTYTRDVIAAFRRKGVLPEYVQVGNEVTPGMLWPDGKLYGVGDPREQWRKFAALLDAGVRGVREGAGPGGRVRIVIHTDTGGRWARTRHFFENLQRHRVPYDVIGLSFYPWWHGSAADLRKTVSNAARTFKKDVWVVETGYPWFEPTEGKYRSRNLTYPATPEGQREFLTEVLKIVSEAPGGRGLGVLWWYPESTPVKGLHVWCGGRNALFDSKGNALPALEAFRKVDRGEGARQ